MDTFYLNTLWVLIASVFVFLMHAGFALVEVGFTQSKNAVNIIMKNFITVSIGVLCYFVVGFGLMYGTSISGVLGGSNFLLLGAPSEMAGISFEAFFLFQAIFAATCATIVSGAMAERTKFTAYVAFCVVATGIIYPIIGHWIWGGGFLSSVIGFSDFAGGTAVHAVGGFCALVGAKMVGPRKGKYRNGTVRAIPGHSIPLGALGVLILWFGWFGFNPGSTLDATSPMTVHAAITTLLSGAAATVAAMILSEVKYGKPDAGLTLNGALAGLVGITAGANTIGYFGSIIIGVLSGILMIYAVEFIEFKLKIDDPVGAISVHGVCGAFGTIMVGVFSTEGGLIHSGSINLLIAQITGVAIVAAVTIGCAYIVFKVIDSVIGLNVGEHIEIKGLDQIEHGISAYMDI